MATQETQQIDAIIDSSRRKMLTVGGAALAGLAFANMGRAHAQAAATLSDTDILNFALNLEYLEAQFYNLAANGLTIDKLPSPISLTGTGTGTAGTVTVKANPQVPFKNALVKAYAMATASDEGKHVSTLQAALGAMAVAMPNIDLQNSFVTLGNLISPAVPNFDPFASDATFLLGAYIFEDVGVSAYSGAAAAITDKVNVLPPATGILAVEAYHAGLIRTTIAGLDAAATPSNIIGPYSKITQAISALRSTITNTVLPVGTTVNDVGISNVKVMLNGTGSNTAYTIVDADSNSLAFARSPQQVLAIVTGNTSGDTTKNQGVFFPQGLNGSNPLVK